MKLMDAIESITSLLSGLPEPGYKVGSYSDIEEAVALHYTYNLSDGLHDQLLHRSEESYLLEIVSWAKDNEELAIDLHDRISSIVDPIYCKIGGGDSLRVENWNGIVGHYAIQGDKL